MLHPQVVVRRACYLLPPMPCDQSMDMFFHISAKSHKVRKVCDEIYNAKRCGEWQLPRMQRNKRVFASASVLPMVGATENDSQYKLYVRSTHTLILYIV
jgi:hypothetical protein